MLYSALTYAAASQTEVDTRSGRVLCQCAPAKRLLDRQSTDKEQMSLSFMAQRTRHVARSDVSPRLWVASSKAPS